MAAARLISLTRAYPRLWTSRIPKFETLSSFLHTTPSRCAGGKWREQRGMSRTGTSYGPLTDLPDWSYLDGRPAPLVPSKRQFKRMKKQQAIGRRIKYLLKEVDLAKCQSESIEMNRDSDDESTG